MDSPRTTPDDVTAAKAALRAELRARRRALDPGVRDAESRAAAAHLWAWLGPRVAAAQGAGTARPAVATVLPMATEPDTGPLRELLWDAGARVLVPVVEPERRLGWVEWHPEVRLGRAAGLPIDEPVGPREGPDALARARAVVLPGLAVDADGMRLGQGGGYYDRALAALPGSVPTVAFVFSHELLPSGSVPVEPTDAPVDGIVTAAGLRWLRAPGPVQERGRAAGQG